MNIQQLANLFRLNKQTIRFYRDQKLLSPPQDAENHYFRYGIDELAALFQILNLRQTDHSLQDIREFMTDGGEALRAYLHKEERHLERVEERLAELTLMRSELQRRINYRRSVIDTQADVRLGENSPGLYFLTLDQFDSNPREVSILRSTSATYQSLVIPLEQFLDFHRQVYLPLYALGVTWPNYSARREYQACDLSRYHTVEGGHTVLRFILRLHDLDRLDAAHFQPVKDFAAARGLRFAAPVTSIILMAMCQPENTYYVLFRFVVEPEDDPAHPPFYAPPTFL